MSDQPADPGGEPVSSTKLSKGDFPPARQGLRAGILLAYREAKIFPGAYHTRLFFINGLPAS
ncbi:hypothetical protein [Noviherbaspirillum soli]|uniref:hypothetical protein n=1 Tax=Noviherbaspirillum soli TaxID=1064518 RepID=UPI00188D2E70|nr:hypothetical protein [Noviherbaspirillum soli]